MQHYAVVVGAPVGGLDVAAAVASPQPFAVVEAVAAAFAAVAESDVVVASAVIVDVVGAVAAAETVVEEVVAVEFAVGSSAAATAAFEALLVAGTVADGLGSHAEAAVGANFDVVRLVGVGMAPGSYFEDVEAVKFVAAFLQQS